eukprot:CAMPEP_0176106664 /NCGR_PEP_ID=MMETSP0120_2-20121206/53526_1 /TAXON_ID=160619 /ORGANISM="Kryptoperidinium foliaceum, Strain CCMP 1326" /LENGTH=641 /DNA_ID=CAMNT_0017440785 /DNA_START=108 /DNA_END=2031 /DNA_ORIENTATION=-
MAPMSGDEGQNKEPSLRSRLLGLASWARGAAPHDGQAAPSGMAMRRSGSSNFSELAEEMVGRWSVASRYHQLPTRIEDDYAIMEKVLGSGYNGLVRMARGRGGACKQTFAVKAFKLDGLSEEKRAQLDSEVAVFLGMDHPHVARLYDVYETSDSLHMVMECLEGGELFDRVMERKRFSESDAAEATRQMLLVVNYLHSHGVVHRDLKLENFLYDLKTGDTLKLIDFGFSKMFDPLVKMCASCGTMAYVAPEVLRKSYTSQCDMWSLGVIAFILLAGYMPFTGSQQAQRSNIQAGKYILKEDRWSSVSQGGLEFVQALLQVDPCQRLTAEQALEHPWIAQRCMQTDVEIDAGILEGLRQFSGASKFRRCCMQMMAWSLSREERDQVRDYFVSLDTSHQGTITLMELKQVMSSKFHISDDETRRIFEAMDSNHDESIHYSDFLAAMMNARLAMHDDLLRSAFRRFDADASGYITADNLREVLGDVHEGENVETLLKEADLLNDGRISYAEFVAFLRGEPLQLHGVAEAIIDSELKKREGDVVSTMGTWAQAPAHLLKRRSSRSLLPPLSVSTAPAPETAAMVASPSNAVKRAAGRGAAFSSDRRRIHAWLLRTRQGREPAVAMCLLQDTPGRAYCSTPCAFVV